MNTGQSMLSLGALILFSFLSVNFNSTILENTTVETENKVYLTAFSLADDLIEEIKKKAFDERTVDFQAIDQNQLTYPLGPEAGEVWPYFNDMDDYNNYIKPVNLPHVENYEVSCTVNYVNSSGTDLSSQSYFKKVTIKVSSMYLRNPIYIKFIFSLHSKN